MFRVFSGLRQQLMREGRTLRYLGYAAGEILLVVIGILIALQINSWAEERSDRAFERTTLAQIQQNLDLDHAGLQVILANRKQAVLAIDAITTIADPAEPPEELGQWFAAIMSFDRFQPITNAYEVLRSRGMDLVRDDELRFALGLYYDGLAREIPEHNRDIERAFKDLWVPIMLRDFDSFDWKVRATPSDPVRLLGDPQLLKLLKLQRDNHAGTANNIQRMIDVNLELQTRIESSLSG